MPEIDPPAPAAPSTGPQRTRRTGRKSRRRTAEEKAALKKEAWDDTLARFRGQLQVFFVLDGQPPGGLTPEMALAQVFQIAKDDLKNSVSGVFYWILVHHFTNLSTWRQPLHGSKTGEGKRGPRCVEEYLKGLLRILLPAEKIPLTVQGVQVGVIENESAVAVLSRRKHLFPSLRFGVPN